MIDGPLQLLMASLYPEQGADVAAASGFDPPESLEGLASASLPPSLSSLLEPMPQSAFAGIEAPPAPPVMQIGAPAAPMGQGQMPQGSALLDLILGKGSPMIPQGAAVPGLAELLPR